MSFLLCGCTKNAAANVRHNPGFSGVSLPAPSSRVSKVALAALPQAPASNTSSISVPVTVNSKETVRLDDVEISSDNPAIKEFADAIGNPDINAECCRALYARIELAIRNQFEGALWTADGSKSKDPLFGKHIIEKDIKGVLVQNTLKAFLPK